MKPGDGKRRLPVIRPDEPETVRPPWQWALIGAVGGLLVLFPLIQLTQALARRELLRLAPGDDPEATAAAIRALGGWARAWLQIVAVGAQLVPVAIASFLAGMLVGRFGGVAGMREAALAGLALGAFIALFGAPSMFESGQIVAWLVASLLFVGLGTLGGRLGGRLGLRLRA